MQRLFPASAKFGQLKGTIKIIREHRGTISISSLAKKAHQNIDQLLPVVDACVALDIAKTSNGSISLTPYGKKLNISNTKKLVTDKIVLVEPFKSTVQILKTQGDLRTDKLSRLLFDRGIAMYRDNDINTGVLRELLLRWGVRCGLLRHNARLDEWSLGTVARSTGTKEYA
jgi:hypothetical protein